MLPRMLGSMMLVSERSFSARYFDVIRTPVALPKMAGIAEA
jgi:hypothetical protein